GGRADGDRGDSPRRPDHGGGPEGGAAALTRADTGWPRIAAACAPARAGGPAGRPPSPRPGAESASAGRAPDRSTRDLARLPARPPASACQVLGPSFNAAA